MCRDLLVCNKGLYRKYSVAWYVLVPKHFTISMVVYLLLYDICLILLGELPTHGLMFVSAFAYLRISFLD